MIFVTPSPSSSSIATRCLSNDAVTLAPTSVELDAAAADFHPSVLRNTPAIGQVLRRYVTAVDRVFEIGAGDGGHIVLLAPYLSFSRWQCSEASERLDALRAQIHRLKDPRVVSPSQFQLGSDAWPDDAATRIFTANTLHIMNWASVEALFNGAGARLPRGGLLLCYGPFAVDGAHISDGNTEFDRSLRQRGAGSGIRDTAALAALARSVGLRLTTRFAMPANNLMLLWEKG